jgi:hypothetical protein
VIIPPQPVIVPPQPVIVPPQPVIVPPQPQPVVITPEPQPVVIISDPADRNIPRVMFWWGKVNQHWNLEKGVWETDTDGISGAREDKLAYCQKFYPTTTKVIEYKKETTDTWRNAYNQGQFTSIKLSYRCVLENENVSQEDVAKRLEKPDSGSICYYYPNLDYCRPFGGENPGVNPPAIPLTPTADQVKAENAVKSTIVTSTSKDMSVSEGPIKVDQTMTKKVDLLTASKVNYLLEETGQSRNLSKERENEIIYLKNLQSRVRLVSTTTKQALVNFITYGVDESTQSLSAKERAAAVSTYKAAFNKLPETKTELADTVKIASGEAPEKVSVTAETKAKAEFKKIYKRAVDLKKPEEANTIKVLAYGLKPAVRNLNAEKVGVAKFFATYKRAPKSDSDWNIVKAIAYSQNVK